MTSVGLPPGKHPEFDLTLLGGFRLRSATGAVGVPRGSQRLLAFLALRGGIVKRAAVAGALWPDAAEHHAYSNLRAAIARLNGAARKALAASKLELGLAEGVTVDLHHAQPLAQRLLDPAATPAPSDLNLAAVAALSADLLPDWYDDWVLTEAEDWRQLRLHALEALARHLTTRAGGARRPAPPVRPCAPSRSGRAATPPSSRCTSPRATSRRRWGSSRATGRCCVPSSASSPPPGSTSWCATCGARPRPDRRREESVAVTLASRWGHAPGPRMRRHRRAPSKG
jgi:hypothetical protein